MPITNVKMRQAKIEYGATTALGSTFGLVKDVKLKISPAVIEIDSQGEPQIPGYKLEGQFRLMQNRGSDFDDIFALCNGTEYYVKFTDRNDDSLSFHPSTSTVFYIDTEVDMNGKADGILVKFTMNITPDGLVDLV